jgi:hypothetical protein
VVKKESVASNIAQGRKAALNQRMLKFIFLILSLVYLDWMQEMVEQIQICCAF